jgi:hypothetical protein
LDFGSVREALMRLDFAHQSLVTAEAELSRPIKPPAGVPDLTDEDIERGRLDVWMVTARDVLSLHDIILQDPPSDLIRDRVREADEPLREQLARREERWRELWARLGHRHAL